MNWINRHKFLLSLLYPAFMILNTFCQRIGYCGTYDYTSSHIDVYLFDFPFYAALFIIISIICVGANIYLKIQHNYQTAINLNLSCYSLQFLILAYWWILHHQREYNYIDFPEHIDYIGIFVYFTFITLPLVYLLIHQKKLISSK